MSALKSKQYLLLAIIGVSAFLATFYVVYAGMIPVQWSREQPAAAVVGATVEVLDPSSMKLYQDEGLSDELTAGETLEFPVPQFQPPLDQLPQVRKANVPLWLKNESNIPLAPIAGFCCIDVFDSQTGERVGAYGITDEGCCGEIPPGEARKLRIELHPDGEVIGRQFTIVIGALGEAPVAQAVGFVGQGPNGEPLDFGPATAAPGVIVVAANGERIFVQGDQAGDTFAIALQGATSVFGNTPLADRNGDGVVTTADLEIVIPAAEDLLAGQSRIAPGDITITSILSVELGVVGFQVVRAGLEASNAVFDLRYATLPFP